MALDRKRKVKLAIVIVAWNHFHTTTRPAIDSVLAMTGVPYRLLVVDNGSHDDTRAELQRLARRDARITPIFLDLNRGWAEGSRRALEFLDDDETHVCLLNSDVQVTPGWAKKLLRLLESDARPTCVIPLENADLERGLGRESAAPLEIPGSAVPPEPWPMSRIMKTAARVEKLGKGLTRPAAPSGFCLLARRADLPVIDAYLADFDAFFSGRRDWREFMQSFGVTCLAALDTFVYHTRGGSGGYYAY